MSHSKIQNLLNTNKTLNANLDLLNVQLETLLHPLHHDIGVQVIEDLLLKNKLDKLHDVCACENENIKADVINRIGSLTTNITSLKQSIHSMSTTNITQSMANYSFLQHHEPNMGMQELRTKSSKVFKVILNKLKNN